MQPDRGDLIFIAGRVRSCFGVFDNSDCASHSSRDNAATSAVDPASNDALFRSWKDASVRVFTVPAAAAVATQAARLVADLRTGP